MCGDIDGDGGANYDPDEQGNDNEYWTHFIENLL